MAPVFLPTWLVATSFTSFLIMLSRLLAWEEEAVEELEEEDAAGFRSVIKLERIAVTRWLS